MDSLAHDSSKPRPRQSCGTRPPARLQLAVREDPCARSCSRSRPCSPSACWHRPRSSEKGGEEASPYAVTENWPAPWRRKGISGARGRACSRKRRTDLHRAARGTKLHDTLPAGSAASGIAQSARHRAEARCATASHRGRRRQAGWSRGPVGQAVRGGGGRTRSASHATEEHVWVVNDARHQFTSSPTTASSSYERSASPTSRAMTGRTSAGRRTSRGCRTARCSSPMASATHASRSSTGTASS